jgi:hypothetical protein
LAPKERRNYAKSQATYKTSDEYDNPRLSVTNQVIISINDKNNPKQNCLGLFIYPSNTSIHFLFKIFFVSCSISSGVSFLLLAHDDNKEVIIETLTSNS